MQCIINRSIYSLHPAVCINTRIEVVHRRSARTAETFSLSRRLPRRTVAGRDAELFSHSEGTGDAGNPIAIAVA